MSLHTQVVHHLEERFNDFFKEQTRIESHNPIHGGDINQCFLLETNRGKYFMKVNASLFGLDFFEKEARGLVILANTGAIRVPRPLFDGKFHQQVYLVMEYLKVGQPAQNFWENFGESMAEMHKNTQEKFGLSFQNYIGRLHQPNNAHEKWSDFYKAERIIFLMEKARKSNLLSSEELIMAEKLCGKIDQLIPEEIPALLHGDLWKGNFIVHENGTAAVFDPAVYYGHREMDLAMAQLFGGFESQFFEAYN
ncbi:MAG: fructosamine kinase family protein, partial [Chitinophagaceae bacterium]